MRKKSAQHHAAGLNGAGQLGPMSSSGRELKSVVFVLSQVRKNEGTYVRTSERTNVGTLYGCYSYEGCGGWPPRSHRWRRRWRRGSGSSSVGRTAAAAVALLCVYCCFTELCCCLGGTLKNNISCYPHSLGDATKNTTSLQARSKSHAVAPSPRLSRPPLLS